MLPEFRARAGIFLSFQHPTEIPGVRFDQFLRAAYNALRKSRGEDELDPIKFNRVLRDKLASLEMDPALVQRNVNQGFSGGEKKRMEIFQMAVLEPRLAILDETDSALTSTRSERWPPASTASAAPTTPYCWLPTISAF